MNLFFESHQKLLKKLLSAEVDFIVIGGYSVIFHGYPRTTGDVDIWLRPDNKNKTNLIEALKNEGVQYDILEKVNELDFTQHIVLSIWEEPEKVDFLTKINLIKYDEATKNKIIAEVDGISVPFLHLNDLILSKINTGRAKDQADIEELQKLEKTKKKNKKK